MGDDLTSKITNLEYRFVSLQQISMDCRARNKEHEQMILTLLHGDDSELVLLIDPSEESLLLIVVDPPALRPVPLHASGNQVLVARNKQEVVVNQLLPNFLLHALKKSSNAFWFT